VSAVVVVWANVNGARNNISADKKRMERKALMAILIKLIV
jgi:hypothetical protein